MHRISLVRHMLTGLLIFSVAGCSGAGSTAPAVIAGSQPQPQSRSFSAIARQDSLRPTVPGADRATAPDLSPGFADADAAATGAIIMTINKTPSVFVYSNAGKLVAKISGFNNPAGLSLGPNGDLYVANTFAGNVLVYKNDYKTLKAKLLDFAQYPTDADVDSKTGVVGVANIGASGGGPGSVLIYAPGATTPCATLSSPRDFYQVQSGAFDKNGNFYIDGQDGDPGVARIGVVRGGCSATSITTLTTGNQIAVPGAIKVSPAGKIVFADEQTNRIYTYDPPVNNALGKPVSTTTVGYGPDWFAFTNSGTDLWATQYGVSGLHKYRYPAGGPPIATLATYHYPTGLALTPLAKP